MKDVGVEYKVGPKVVVAYIIQELFHTSRTDALQWQLLTARIMEQNMQMGALSKARFMKRNLKWASNYDIQADAANLERAQTFIKENVSDEAFAALMADAVKLRKEKLRYEELTGENKAAAEKGAWHIKVAIAMVVFVVFCFLTECIPLPGVAFCIGLILVFTGVVSRQEVASLYWDDACWFIMGSLMFAAAFVKTGVDKRVCLMMFRKLAVPNVKWITLVFFIIIAPLAVVHLRPCPGRHVSAHRDAAVSEQPYAGSAVGSRAGQDADDRHCHGLQHRRVRGAFGRGPQRDHDDLPERHVRHGYRLFPMGELRDAVCLRHDSRDLAGGELALQTPDRFPGPGHGASAKRNRQDGGLEPQTGDRPDHLRGHGLRAGSRKRSSTIWASIRYAWASAVIAVAGAIAYLLAGIVNWRDYQEKVDWGVVWLYAGAIIFGKTLDETGSGLLAGSVLHRSAGAAGHGFGPSPDAGQQRFDRRFNQPHGGRPGRGGRGSHFLEYGRHGASRERPICPSWPWPRRRPPPLPTV